FWPLSWISLSSIRRDVYIVRYIPRSVFRSGNSRPLDFGGIAFTACIGFVPCMAEGLGFSTGTGRGAGAGRADCGSSAVSADSDLRTSFNTLVSVFIIASQSHSILFRHAW